MYCSNSCTKLAIYKLPFKERIREREREREREGGFTFKERFTNVSISSVLCLVLNKFIIILQVIFINCYCFYCFPKYISFLIAALFPRSFVFRCKGDDEKGKKLSFELEICSVPGLENMIGKLKLQILGMSCIRHEKLLSSKLFKRG